MSVSSGIRSSAETDNMWPPIDQMFIDMTFIDMTAHIASKTICYSIVPIYEVFKLNNACQ